MGRIAVLENTFPAAADPWTETISRERFEEINEIGLEGRMSLYENHQASRARRLSVKAVPTDDAAAHGFEYLRRFGWGQALEIGFEALHREFRAEELFDHGSEVAEH